MLPVNVIHRKTTIRVEEKPLSCIPKIKFFCQPADKNHRKFKPLAAVDTHNAHRVLPLGSIRRFPVIHLILNQALHIADELEQAAVRTLPESRCLFHKYRQVLAAPAARRHRFYKTVITRFLKELLQKLRNCKYSAPLPEHLVNTEKIRKPSGNIIFPFPCFWLLFYSIIPNIFLLPRQERSGAVLYGLRKRHMIPCAPQLC